MAQRMFVAVVPPTSVLTDLERFMEPRWDHRDAASRPAWRWTRPASWHITLAFMPAVVDVSLERLTAELSTAAARSTPIDLRLVGAVCFPDASRAKLLAAGVSGGLPELDRLATRVRTSVNRAGVEADGGPFRPHLTLGRSNRCQVAVKWLELLDTYQSPQWTVSEIELIASHLGEGPDGSPKYVTVERIPLSSPS